MRSLELQRYGRNKSTQINKAYIESGEYRRKFNQITDDANLARLLYTKAKEMLYHRSGTEYEDMYWIDANECSIIVSATNEIEKEKVIYTPGILTAIAGNNSVIAMHNHPHSMPPSLEDFNSYNSHGYIDGIIICHNGKIFRYSSACILSTLLYDIYYAEYYSKEQSEYAAQLYALNELRRNYKIVYEEVL